MNPSRKAHDRAMDLAHFADRARATGDLDEAARLFAEALERELTAIHSLDEPSSLTFAVLHRSAAWLALECKEERLAEKLASTALAQEPPPQVANELRDVWEQANYERHLRVNGIVLRPEEFQLSLSGPAVGSGTTEWAGYRARVDDTLRMITRITERKGERPFRHRGPAESEIRKYLRPQVSLPRAASYAVSIRLGGTQIEAAVLINLPEIADVIREFMTIVEKVNDAADDELRELIPDDLYRRNAVALTRQIAPDGAKIKQVGFTSSGVSGGRLIGLTRTRKDLKPTSTNVEEEHVTIQGTLLFADARGASNDIRVVDKKEMEHKIKVPPELMDDIVRPRWNSTVAVHGVRKGNSVTLMGIGPE